MSDDGAAHTLRELVCRYNGVEVFRAGLGSGIAANPYLQFFATAAESGGIRVLMGGRRGRARRRPRADHRERMKGVFAAALAASVQSIAGSPSHPRSGIEYAGADVRGMQADDAQNPGMLWIERARRCGQALRKTSPAARAATATPQFR